MSTVILWGPPCAGKSTHVERNANPGDLIVDLDRIAHALTTDGTEDHAYPRHIREAALKARTAIIEDAAWWGLSQPEHTAWIIDSNATAQQLWLWEQAGASIVRLVEPLDVLLERATRRPTDTVGRIHAWLLRHS